MTEHTWATSDDPAVMVRWLWQGRVDGGAAPGPTRGVPVHTCPEATDRRWRLLLCGCARLSANVLADPVLLAATLVAEDHADGLMPNYGMDRLRDAAYQRALGHGAYWEPVWFPYFAADPGPVNPTGYWSAFWGPDVRAAGLVRCVFNPWHLPAVGERARWGPTVVRLAQAAYEERLTDGLLDSSALAVLADALEDAGHDAGPHDPLLNHLRSRRVRTELYGAPGVWDEGTVPDSTPHCRGCWALDLVRGTP